MGRFEAVLVEARPMLSALSGILSSSLEQGYGSRLRIG